MVVCLIGRDDDRHGGPTQPRGAHRDEAQVRRAFAISVSLSSHRDDERAILSVLSLLTPSPLPRDQAVDEDGNDGIELEEFITHFGDVLAANSDAPLTRAELKQLFMKIDADGNGR